MLVLTRKSNQKIMLGKDIVITVLKVQGDQVSIGIEAPDNLRILREEIFWEIQKENTEGRVQKNSVDIKNLAKNLTIHTKPEKSTLTFSNKQEKEEE